MYSREASYTVIISEWFVDIATRVDFDDFQDVVVPPSSVMGIRHLGSVSVTNNGLS